MYESVYEAVEIMERLWDLWEAMERVWKSV